MRVNGNQRIAKHAWRLSADSHLCHSPVVCVGPQHEARTSNHAPVLFPFPIPISSHEVATMSTDIVASCIIYLFICVLFSSAEARAQTPVCLPLPLSLFLSLPLPRCLFFLSFRLPPYKNQMILDILYLYEYAKYRYYLKKIACAPLETRLSFCDSSAQASQRTGESVNRLVVSRRPACDDAIVSGSDRDIDSDNSCTRSFQVEGQCDP